ncbi:MAG: aminotransferase class I/II-fold pyridoxal phosphate-dependent enzyme [Sphaerochaetaceae bacterium]|nr:aminotransferase class I/II-fold pyridoxal phosphate-dependent enzyme [Sphaerochaetaceae bacterium]
MDRLAEALNGFLKDTPVYSMLSDYGKRMYVPKGIIVQSAEAKAKAGRFNATIGVALENSQPMFIPSIKEQFASSMKSTEIFSYAPMGGVAPLREAWLRDMRKKNPDLENAELSLPVVCSGLTNALSLVSSLFLDKGDSLVLPSMYWENYNLLFTEGREADLVTFDNFNAQGGFNTEGLDKAISSVKGEKAVILLNFPNNPTGYTPTEKEAQEIADLVVSHAEKGKKIVFICDDAYFGLFFSEDVNRQSLFSKLYNAHENILAVKCDGATKEYMVWGFRVAFITYASKALGKDGLNALVQKTMGAVRGSLSSCSTSAQNILLKAITDPSIEEAKKEGVDKICRRYSLFRKALENYRDRDSLKPYPFNSGYFMSFETKCDAEELRQKLLNDYQTGTICLGEHLLRIAYSSVDEKDIADLVDVLYKAADELC